jgi:hypothetical protein
MLLLEQDVVFSLDLFFQGGLRHPQFFSPRPNYRPRLQQNYPIVRTNVIWMDWDVVMWYFSAEDAHYSIPPDTLLIGV